MSTKEEDRKDFWTNVVFMVMFLFIVYLLKENDSQETSFAERIISGKKDTVNINDTRCVFRVKIGTNYYDPKEEEPQQDYR